MRYIVSFIVVLLFSSVGFAGSFSGEKDPRLDHLVELTIQAVKQEGSNVTGHSCIVLHTSKRALCNIYVKGETIPIRVTVPYNEL